MDAALPQTDRQFEDESPRCICTHRLALPTAEQNECGSKGGFESRRRGVTQGANRQYPSLGYICSRLTLRAVLVFSMRCHKRSPSWARNGSHCYRRHCRYPSSYVPDQNQRRQVMKRTSDVNMNARKADAGSGGRSQPQTHGHVQGGLHK